jgi:peptide chain release factor 2
LSSGSARPRGVFDLTARESRLADLEALTGAPGFWDDQRAAQKILREADGLRTETDLWRDLESRAAGLDELFDMANEAGDAEMLAEIGRDAEKLLATYELERTALLFSGEYDGGGAIISISAGAGGTEATDWAEMLLRMYLRWAERHRFKTEIVDQTEGEQTGLKSVTVEVDGRRGAPPRPDQPV